MGSAGHLLDTPWLYWEFKVEKDACESARLINDMPMFKNELDPCDGRAALLLEYNRTEMTTESLSFGTSLVSYCYNRNASDAST